MSSSLHQQAVLTGSLHSFCLACDAILKTDADVPLHVQEPVHQKNLDTTPYFEKFKGEGIRKVNRGYYCEHCNTLLPIVSKVSLHVADSSHISNRGTHSLRLTGPGVVALDEVLIREKAWHGLTEDVCLLCNTEFNDESLHTSSVEHSLNLVQKCVEFGPSNGIHRQVDETTCQCLTCNTVISSSMLADHLKDSEHLKQYEHCRKEYNKIKECEKVEDILTGLKVDENDNLTDNGEGLAIAIKYPANIDNTENRAVLVANDKIQNLPENAVSFAQDNEITLSAKYRNAYCRICNKRFPSNLQNMKEHVTGGPHIKKLAKIRAMPKYTKAPIKTFVKSIINIELCLEDEMVINEKYCLKFSSVFMLMATESGLRCQICEVNLSRIDEDVIKRHCESSQHDSKMIETPVLTSLVGEFVREVREDSFHCGFCNIVVAGWEVLEVHLNSAEHKESRHAAESRLQKHLPSVRNHFREQQAREMVMRMLMRNF